ncbi:hypothetical protein AHAS_Ahas17G0221900 [Arachis hypogaea]
MPRPSGKDAFEEAESEKKMMTFDWYKQILANYVSTHETHIIVDMAVLVWCVLEATEAEVVWITTDERPTIIDSKKVIPHGD